MQEKQVSEEILRYLDDDNYNYAVLIDGEWGCGKTYFVLNKLYAEIKAHEENEKNREIKYISLYGCSSTAELEKNIYWSIVDKTIYKIKKGLEKQTSTLSENESEKKNKRTRMLMIGTKKLVGTIMDKYNLEDTAYVALCEYVALDKYIFIIDDLERCNCPINDILGYINNLVEHENAKVILIANEKEIGRIERVESKELQDLVAAQPNICIDIKPNSHLTSQSSGQNQNFTIDQLKTRRKLLYAELESNQKYKEIREKLIGITIQYEPDISVVMHRLIGKYCEIELKEFLNNNVAFFIEVMQEYGHMNLRTFQFFLSKISYIYKRISEYGINEIDIIMNDIVKGCFEECVKFKANHEIKHDLLYRMLHPKIKIIPSIKKYIEKSTFDENEVRDELQQYVFENVKQKIDINDPFNLLKNSWYIEKQQWVEGKILEIKEKLSKDEYPVYIYPQLLKMIMRLQKIGFSVDIVDIMENNLKSREENFPEEWYMVEDEEFFQEFKFTVKEINREVNNHIKRKVGEKLISIIEQINWGQELKKCSCDQAFMWKYKEGIINQIQPEVWIKKLVETDSENIFEFRQFIQKIFPEGIEKQRITNDIETAKKIADGLKEQISEIDDLIKQAQLRWLMKDLQLVYSSHSKEKNT